MDEIRTRLDAVIAAMRATGAWDVERPGPFDPQTMGAFGIHVMAFTQWLRWVFVPSVQERLETDGPWPAGSAVAVQAAREDCPDDLVSALAELDELFMPPVDANAHGFNLLQEGKVDRAITMFRIAAGVPQAAPNLGDALLAAGRPDEALAAVEKAAAGSGEIAARAHSWLGWYFTAKQPHLQRALGELELATALAPTFGPAWLNLAKAHDANGDIARACAAYGTAIECGDAHDDAFARDRRLQLEMQLLSRGETPPPVPETARADSAAFAIVQTTASRLRTAHAFMIRPTARRGTRVMPAVIGTVVDGRAVGHCIVGAETHTLGAGGLLVAGDHLFDRLSTGFDPKELTVIDAAMVVFDFFHGTGWEVRDGALVVNLAVDVAVSPLDGGGVVLGLPDTIIEVPTIAGFRERLTLLEIELAAATR